MKTKNIIIMVVVLAVGWLGIRYFQQEPRRETPTGDSLIYEEGLGDKSEKGKAEKILCFGERSLSDFGTEASPEYNYSMTVLDISDPDHVQGYARYYPYGTDIGVSSLTGVYHPETHVLHTRSSSYAEGMNFEERRIWKFEDDQLVSGYTQRQLAGQSEDFKNLDTVTWNTESPHKRIDCATVDVWLDEVYAQYEHPDPDYERVRKIVGDKELDESTLITERYLDADNNWQTQETLIFLESPQGCDEKGCTLFLVNEKDEILKTFHDVQKPILIGNTVGKKTWADLVVWSEGSYRLLKHEGDSYPSDLTQTIKLSKRDVEWHPEKYFMVMSR